MMRAALLIATLLWGVCAEAQEPGSRAIPRTPAPRAEDVASPDAIIAAMYDVISGPAGQKRDWDRMRSLFQPGARMVALGRSAKGELRCRVMTPDDYIRTSGPMLEERGFVEREAARRVEQFGGVYHAWSTYEGRLRADDKEPFVRGVNSIQLMHDGSRWWIVSLLWQAEDPGLKLPAEYLPKP